MPTSPDYRPIFLPLSRFKPVDLRKDSKLPKPGILLPQEPALPLMLAMDGGHAPSLLYLEGENAFRHGFITLGTFAKGAMIEDVEFIADINSRYDTNQADPFGALVIEGGNLFVMGGHLGDFHGPNHPVPLWGRYEGANSEVRLGFTRWKIVVREGTEEVTIWPRPVKRPIRANSSPAPASD